MSSSERAGDQQPLKLPTAQLMWVLAEHVRGLERHGLERFRELRLPLGRAQPGEVARPDHPEHAVGLEDRVVRAERILEDPLDLRVVAPEVTPTEGATRPDRRT